MEVTDLPERPDTRPGDPPESTDSAGGSRGAGRNPVAGCYRLFVRSGHGVVGVVGLLALSATASAHGGVGDGGSPAAFVVVVGLPVVGGLLGGSVAIRYRGMPGRFGGRRRTDVALGLLLVVLGSTFALAALPRGPAVAIAGGAVGAVVAVGTARRELTPGPGRADHADLALGAVCLHRVLEGVAVGTLYSAGAVVGLVGAVFIAGHAALETTAVGGLYATATGRRRAVGAIFLVQAGYAAGAVVGLGAAVAVPVAVRTLALGVVGGALLAVGVGRAEHSVARLGAAGSE